MKKIYFLALFVMPFISKAQTITQSDLPSAGLAWINAIDTLFTDPIPAGGSGQTWDLSTALTFDEDDTVGFVTAASTPYSGNFPGANLAAYDQGNNIYSYFTSNTNGFYVNGFVTPTGSPIRYVQPLMYIPVPLSFGSTVNSVGRLQVDTTISGSQLRVTQFTQANFNVDGSGTLILPNATHNNVLRVRITELRYDTISANLGGFYVPISNAVSQNTTYRFLKAGSQPALVATIFSDSLGQFGTSAEYVSASTVSIAEVSERTATVYPNPADKHITFEMEIASAASVRIHDRNGKLVYEGTLEGKNPTLETAEFANGLYFFQIESKGSVQRGKFNIQH